MRKHSTSHRCLYLDSKTTVEGGWNKGTYAQTDTAFTVEHDRDVSFLVDKADVDETNATASIQNISKVFEQTQVVPETERYSSLSSTGCAESDWISQLNSFQ